MNKYIRTLINVEPNWSKFVGVSDPGSPEKEIKHGVLLKDGTIDLVVDRIENTDALIQSFAASADINNIIRRIDNGEISLLNERQGYFFDSVGMPGTYAEILNLVIQGKQVFEKLPVDVKQRFDNDFNKWFAAMDQSDFLEKSGLVRSVDTSVSSVDKSEVLDES